ncbi:hypothetical protein O988_01974 [Pseudogymnoascus sp. VKM F-3808]|nr:hypothetical protein O988_01974 [Pseudogymnoascus sp. VKM F-3808]
MACFTKADTLREVWLAPGKYGTVQESMARSSLKKYGTLQEVWHAANNAHALAPVTADWHTRGLSGVEAR